MDKIFQNDTFPRLAPNYLLALAVVWLLSRFVCHLPEIIKQARLFMREWRKK